MAFDKHFVNTKFTKTNNAIIDMMQVVGKL